MSNSLKAICLAFILFTGFAYLIIPKEKLITSKATISLSEFDELIAIPITKISAVDLADFLMKQQHHYNLIDLQTHNKAAIDNYKIPSAELHSFDSFLKLEIPVNETIILYSTTEIEAVQLYQLLSIRGYFKVQVLTGGIAEWKQQILFPVSSDIEITQLGKRDILTRFFGGNFNSSNKLFSFKEIILEKKIKKHHGC